ncbi:copper amine oxidase N-terminal domain-containing protein [Tindallia californiensis]|uniref:Copper amine oxidase N-terminal domain-containing protein n=1 Tax=Tindallia californiensis TaxID=159292 RepID=A0A1H3PEI3_9FIRM|nr:copper amine oxidase N-terminal domain-containing protein [Tindallia californiensis]SDY99477.1 Copper amine oxidase N-terminal domain-containing protein [Tindallia californiensis]
MNKMKRRMVSILLAMSLIVPVATFAATENSVGESTVIATEEAIPSGDAYLRIQDDRGDMGTEEQHIRLTLENAEWAPAEEWNPYEFRYYREGSRVANGNNFSVNISRVSSTRLDLRFSLDPADVGRDADEIRIPLKASVSKEGEATVTIDPLNSMVSAGEFVFAEGVTTEAIVRTGEKTTFGPRETAALEDIRIVETAAGSIPEDGTMRFRLPPGFQWVENSNLEIEGEGSFHGSASFTLKDWMPEDREISFSPTDLGLQRSEDTTRGSIHLKGLAITSDGQRFGDVQVITAGILGNQRLTVAEYMDYTVSAKAEGSKPTIYAGRFNSLEGEGYELAPLVIEEEIFASMSSGRLVDVVFPDWVAITKVMGVETEDFTAGDHAFSFIPQRENQDKMRFEIMIETTLHPSAQGEIEASIAGGGIPEPLTVTLGEAVQPVRIDADPVVFVADDEENLSPAIKITESSYRGLMEGVIEIDLGIGEWAETPEVQVETGDLEIGDIQIEGSLLKITIDTDSSVASQIHVAETPVTVEGTPALGTYSLSVGGDALVNNAVESYFDQEYFQELEILQVALNRVTQAVFSLGKNAYYVDGESYELDVAPFIEEGRLMVPVAHVSRALGIPREAVVWEEDAQTVTVTSEDSEMVMTIGSAMLTVDGEERDMGAEAIILENRTFVPISRFARGLGIEFQWDEDAETVTFEF